MAATHWKAKTSIWCPVPVAEAILFVWDVKRAGTYDAHLRAVRSGVGFRRQGTIRGVLTFLGKISWHATFRYELLDNGVTLELANPPPGLRYDRSITVRSKSWDSCEIELSETVRLPLAFFWMKPVLRRLHDRYIKSEAQAISKNVSSVYSLPAA